MLLSAITAPYLGTQCYLIGVPQTPASAPGIAAGSDGAVDSRVAARQASADACLIIDPGMGVTHQVEAELARLGRRPAAILLTHGHTDHVWNSGILSARFDIPVFIHEDDADFLNDPPGHSGPDPEEEYRIAEQLEGTSTWHRPVKVETIRTGKWGTTTLDCAGLAIECWHAPGHTPGSTLFLPRVGGLFSVSSANPATAASLERGEVFSGDVLFAQGIGRTDLPGGSSEEMIRSLGGPVAKLPAEALLYPGHGSAGNVEPSRRTAQSYIPYLS